eukprot:1839124-Rhodomonas_salina.1
MSSTRKPGKVEIQYRLLRTTGLLDYARATVLRGRVVVATVLGGHLVVATVLRGARATVLRARAAVLRAHDVVLRACDAVLRARDAVLRGRATVLREGVGRAALGDHVEPSRPRVH